MNGTKYDGADLPVIERVKQEILDDIRNARVPADVESFAELHDYVDANEYGGACEIDPDTGFIEFTPDQVEFWNHIQNVIDRWLKNGRKD